jgi:cyanophycin synthetase
VLEWRPAAPWEENASPGGEIASDRTGSIHPDYQQIALRAAALFSIDVAGIDLLCPDIEKPFDPSAPAAILEVNPGPDFLWHVRPHQGQPRPVFELYLDYLFMSKSQGGST